jgi:outer membrane protein
MDSTAVFEDLEFALVDLTPKSREMLDDYFSLPEVNLEQIRNMFAEPVFNQSTATPTSKPTSTATLVSHSLDGLGLREVNEVLGDGPSYSSGAAMHSQLQTRDEDREKQAVETLLKSINSPQTNFMQMQSVDFPQWLGQIQFAMLRYGSQSDLTLQDAIYTAIQFSPEIEILRAEVGISQAEITKQQAGFDWGNFIQSSWDERNVPVSSTLDGAFVRQENHTLANSLGVAKRNSIGGNVKLAQDLGFADSNSQFFNPQNQATARLALDFQQPLLQGAGLLTTRSRINIAIVNAAVSQEQFIGGLQTHVLNVIQAYWELTAARGQFVILKRSYDRALETATVVSNRVHLDVGPVQSARSEATLGARRAALLRSEYAVIFAQEKLLRLMFGQYFRDNVNTEVIPTSSMAGPSRVVDMDLELQLGLQCRPEIRQSLQAIKRTSIEQGVARNQLLPLLGLTMSVSNKGLRGNNGLGSAFDDQFNFSDPTYGVGVAYALPFGNRAAKANLRQTQMRLLLFQKEFETVVSNVALEIRNACHNIANATQQREATAQAMHLVDRELNVLKSRAELLLDGDNVGPLYLEDLLSTQERLATAELSFLNASATHALAFFELQRANGSLMRAETQSASQ